jgi:Protein of unknown function (DUF2459)
MMEIRSVSTRSCYLPADNREPVATIILKLAALPRASQLFAIATLALLSACSGIAQRSPEPRPVEPESAAAELLVIRRGWHVDIGLAEADLPEALRSLSADFPGARYLVFGFGDRRYLLGNNSKVPAMLGALWPGPGIILVTGLTASPAEAFGATHVISMPVTPRQAHAAAAFIWQSLSTEHGAIAPLADGPYQGSLFFSATLRYSAFYTCNTWVAELLKAADIPVHSAGVLFAGQLWSQAEALRNPD